MKMVLVYTSDGNVYLKMNGDYLSGNVADNFSAAVQAWPNASSKITATTTTFANSNLDFTTATQSSWDAIMQGYTYSATGYCLATSTDGIELTSLANAKASSKLIQYAGLIFPPNNISLNLDAAAICAMCHEIGHALGLGHSNQDYYPTTEDSIMRYDGYTSKYYTPQAHDINDINNKY